MEIDFPTNTLPVSMLLNRIHQKLGVESSINKGTIGKERAAIYFDKVLETADSLDCDAFIVGSQSNNGLKNTRDTEFSDIDIQFVPRNNTTPAELSKKIKKFLKSFTAKTEFNDGVNIEAGREYVAIPIALEGQISILTQKETLEKGALTSIRIVNVKSKYPWQQTKSGSMFRENATIKGAIVDIGFPPYDENTRSWLTTQDFDPTQKKIIKIDKDILTVIECRQYFDKNNFDKLSPKSRAILTLRCYAAGIDIDCGNLESFNRVTGDNIYVFLYNLIPSLDKIQKNRSANILTNKYMVENVIKFTFPYMYKILHMLDESSGNLQNLFNKIYNIFGQDISILKLLSLSVQSEISDQKPQDGKHRDKAMEIGRIVETNLENFNANKIAFEEINH